MQVERESLRVSSAADGRVTRRNLPKSGGQQSETTANTAYVLREKVGDLFIDLTLFDEPA